MTQAGCYQLVLDRRLGEYCLPDGWVVMAAGNPASERGVHFAMPRPLRNRFVHLDLEPDLDDWCQWAIRAHIRPEIIAFLRFKPELLYSGGRHIRCQCMADTAVLGDGIAGPNRGGPTARRRASLSGAGEFEALLLDGTVGQAAASELVAFLRLFRELPSIDEILLNPATAKVPTEPSAQIAIATALGTRPDRHLGRERDGLSRADADRDAGDGHARCGGARHRHHAHAGVRSLWG